MEAMVLVMFGLWCGKQVDGMVYQEGMRSKW